MKFSVKPQEYFPNGQASDTTFQRVRPSFDLSAVSSSLHTINCHIYLTYLICRAFIPTASSGTHLVLSLPLMATGPPKLSPMFLRLLARLHSRTGQTATRIL